MILLAEIVDFQRFPHPRELMAYLGLVPSEYSSGATASAAAPSPKPATPTRGACSWKPPGTIATAPRSAGRWRRAAQGQPTACRTQAWRAQQRLHRRYRHLVGHGKRPPVAVTAVARELVGFIWAAMTQQSPAAA